MVSRIVIPIATKKRISSLSHFLSPSPERRDRLSAFTLSFAFFACILFFFCASTFFCIPLFFTEPPFPAAPVLFPVLFFAPAVFLLPADFCLFTAEEDFFCAIVLPVTLEAIDSPRILPVFCVLCYYSLFDLRTQLFYGCSGTDLIRNSEVCREGFHYSDEKTTDSRYTFYIYGYSKTVTRI